MVITLHEAADPAEWEQACALLQHVYVQGGYTTAANAATMMTRERLQGEGTLLVAEGEQRTLVGAVLFLHADSALKQLAKDGEREFRMLGVHPEARGSGAGEALVRACMERARNGGASALVLWTQPTMPAAHRLYERMGFVRAPERDVPDPRGFTRLVYVWRPT